MTQDWQYKEEELRHPTTGAIGARTPQGDTVYGPLAEQYLTPLTQQPTLKVEEPESPVKPAQHILDSITPESRLAEYEAERQRQMEEWQKRQDELMKDQRTRADEAAKVIDERKTEPLVRDLQEEYRVQQTLEQERQALSQALELQRRAITMVEQRDAAIAALGQQAIATPFISGQQARIAESFDRRISSMAALAGAQSAYAQALQGNVSQARALIGDIVDAYTYDTQLELSKINMFMDLNRDEINMLDKNYQNALKESQRYWENQLQQEQSEREAVLNLMLQYPQAGVGLDDTVAQAVQKTSQWLGIQPDQDVRSLMAQFPTAGITEKDTFTEAINKISQMPVELERPQIFGSATTGYYEQYQKPDGTWATRQVVGAAPTGTGVTTVGQPTQTQLEKWGIPPIVAAQPWAITLGQLMEATPVDWFDAFVKDMEARDAATQGREVRTISPQEKQARWDEYRSEVLWGLKAEEKKEETEMECWTNLQGQRICM